MKTIMAPKKHFLVLFLLIALTVVFSATPKLSQAQTRHTEGLIESKPNTFAIVGATVHVSPTKSIENGTIIVRNGKFEAVGADLEVPADAKKFDVEGKHVYAGFIESYLWADIELPEDKGTAYWNTNVRSHVVVAEQFNRSLLDFKKMREGGFTSALVVPKNGVLKGTSSFMLLSEAEPESLLLNSKVAQHALLTASRGGRGYPNSPMGAVALARQTFLDAQWYQKAHRAAKVEPSIGVPETNSSLAALESVLTGEMPLVIETSNELFVLRADRFAKEFGVRLIVKGNGNEYRRLNAISELGKPIILPLNFPAPPDVSDPTAAMDVSLETLMHWDHAPENPGRLANAGVPIALTSAGMKKPTQFIEKLGVAVKRGLAPESALAAITTVPAKLFGVQDQVGSIESGKIANLVVLDKPLFEHKTKIVETWVAGIRYPANAKKPDKPTGSWIVESEEEKVDGLRLVIAGEKKLTARIELAEENTEEEDSEADFNDDSEEEPEEEPEDEAADDDEDKEDENEDSSDKKESSAKSNSVKIQKLSQNGDRISGMFDGEKLDFVGMHRFSLLFAEESSAIGQFVNASGGITSLRVKRIVDEDVADENAEEKKKKESEKPADESQDDESQDDENKTEGPSSGADPSSKEEVNETEKKSEEPGKKCAHGGQMASFDVNFPLGSFGRSSAPETATSTLIKNVTVWTCGERGVIENGAVLIDDGKIVGIYGGDDGLPDADTVIDGSGKHLTPGIIDCHSHMATDSGINESGQAVTAEVRIGDMIDCDDMNIFRQLAGGVTCVNVLHGSANPIGGQNQVIKLRWGSLGEEMKFAEAPTGIKFALGENVKRSRSPESTRYPRTRMGVEQIFHDRFRAAIEYRGKQKRYELNREGLPPRVDLELETIAEIVEGTRWIHCHSYRQDEILALLNLLDEYKITIGSLQHILEGYKVADAMKKHGAMASSFSDWWAYKFEVYDAIPYNGALMHNAGVIVSFNSDDRELARHLNHEAAKAVKYGGVPEEEALKFVTLNPAKQLRIDQYTGSIEAGKHADLAIWSGPPLSPRSRCEQTWVDGKKYFDIEQAAFEAELFSTMRNQLVQKILGSGKQMSSGGGDVDPASLWPRHDEFCHGHDEHEHDQ